jgi:hypothetical protein
MLDMARVAALLFAFTASLRARYGVGKLAALALALLVVREIGPPLAHRAVGEAGLGSGFALVFLGPSQLEPRSWLRALEGLVAVPASALAFARARPLRPESGEARAWDSAGLRFLSVAILSAIMVVFDLLLARLTRDP